MPRTRLIVETHADVTFIELQSPAKFVFDEPLGTPVALADAVVQFVSRPHMNFGGPAVGNGFSSIEMSATRAYIKADSTEATAAFVVETANPTVSVKVNLGQAQPGNPPASRRTTLKTVGLDTIHDVQDAETVTLRVVP